MKRTRGAGVALALSASISLLLMTGCASSGGGRGDGERAERPKRTVILTSRDDSRVGREAAEQVEVEIGTLDDPELVDYVAGIGRKLLRGLPRRDFAYKFQIVDQMEPNAFALPGGFIFVSRGLLALANDEDELACVLGHEIVHAARRHTARRQAYAATIPGLTLPRSRAQALAAYGRDMEREADELGQRLCAAAGYDPMGMSTFMRRLDQRERLLTGAPRAPTFFDTHPGTRERASSNAIRSRELRWTRDPALGDTRERLLDHIEGMVIGDRPETGLFLDELFVHPGLGFEIRFPSGWSVQNSNRVVGASSPRRDAAVFLEADMPEGDLVTLADGFVEELSQDLRVSVKERKRLRLGDIDAVRYGMTGSTGGLSLDASVTFFPFAGGTWKIIGVNPSAAGDRYVPLYLLTTRSFGPIRPGRLDALRTNRLRIALARRGEDLRALGERTGNAWTPAETALANGHLGNEIFEGGEWTKILVREKVELEPRSASPSGR